MKRVVVPMVAAALVVVSMASVPVGAHGAAADTGSVSQIEGWSGDQPTPVGLSVTSGGALSAAFTTRVGRGATLWVADRSSGGTWSPAASLASGVDATSAQFAEDKAGAAVAGWDVPDGGGATTFVAVRSSATAAWSEPTAVVTDSLAAHQPSVGIDAAGSVTVAYLHEAAGDAQVFTRRLVDGSWTAPLQHSTAPAVQLLMGVAGSGYVTLAWSQVDPSTEPVADDTGDATLYGQRFLAPSSTWEAARSLGSNLPPTGLVDLAVNANDQASLVYYERSDGRVLVALARDIDGFGADACWPHCPNEWIFTLMGDEPAQAVSLNDAPEVQTFVASRREELDGSHSISTAQDNGTYFGHASTVSGSGDVDRPQLARADAQPGYADRVGVSWLTHTSDGDLLGVRGEWVPSSDDPVVDAAGTTLGLTGAAPAMAVEPRGDIDVLWPDATAGTLRMSTVSATLMLAPTRVYAQTTAVPVGWHTTTPAGAAVRFDVRVRQATARRGFGAWAAWRSTAATTATFRSRQGRTVCLSTRVHPSADRLSGWSTERCTTTAVNDTSLTGTGWHRHRSTSFYGHSLRSSSRRGASLSLTRLRAKSIALLVSRRPNAGRVRVSFGGRTIATVSTAGRRGDTVVVPVATFPTGRRGDLKITVVSRGKPVNLDGVFVSAR